MIKKDTFERFLTKYSVGGLIETAAWTVTEDSVSTEGTDSVKNLIVFVKGPSLGIEPCSLTVLNTSQLRSMLGLFGDEIEVSVLKDARGKPMALGITDGSTKSKFALGSDLAKPVVPKLLKLPDPLITLLLDAKAISTFIKSKSVLPDEEHCAVISDGTTARLVVGYEPKRNTTEVSIELKAVENSIIEPIYFQADKLRLALSVNKDATEIKWHITPPKFSRLTFTIEGFSVDYYAMPENK